MKRSIHALLFVSTIALCSGSLLAQTQSIPALTAEKFLGKYRKGPKTSIARNGAVVAPPKSYANLHTLLVSLPKDSAMRAKYPALRQHVAKWPKTRLPEETRNVQIRSCWIVSAKHEAGADGDRDFHVVISNSPTNFKEVMNAEVSALPKPKNADSAQLRNLRAAFLGLATNPPGSAFAHLNPPKHVLIEGSLYFDGDHNAGGDSDPGPARAKPKSVWEIHPVTRIVAFSH
jgi:hypothetical protein